MTSANLPAIVTRVGGALEKVVSEIEAYTDERYPLTRNGQMALARMIEDRPELNSESRVSLLVDALSYHGVNQRTEFTALVDRYDIEVVYLALDYLYEVGQRDRGTTTPVSNDKYNSMKYVREVVELIIKLRALGVHVSGVESLSDVVYHLGGLDLAIDASDEDIQSIPFTHN